MPANPTLDGAADASVLAATVPVMRSGRLGARVETEAVVLGKPVLVYRHPEGDAA